MSNTTCLSGIPIGTSTSPVLLTFPTREKIFVPLLFSVPMPANQPAPFSIISGTVAQVSTLFRFVGLPQIPLTAVRVYFGRGSPTRPSIAAIRALDSPLTKAPAPLWIVTSKVKPEPRMFSPRKPYSRACPSAVSSTSRASGYSCRM
jgi:hypothetical protein